LHGIYSVAVLAAANNINLTLADGPIQLNAWEWDIRKGICGGPSRSDGNLQFLLILSDNKQWIMFLPFQAFGRVQLLVTVILYRASFRMFTNRNHARNVKYSFK
jgi:hypothetical protein